MASTGLKAWRGRLLKVALGALACVPLAQAQSAGPDAAALAFGSRSYVWNGMTPEQVQVLKLSGDPLRGPAQPTARGHHRVVHTQRQHHQQHQAGGGDQPDVRGAQLGGELVGAQTLALRHRLEPTGDGPFGAALHFLGQHGDVAALAVAALLVLGGDRGADRRHVSGERF